MSWSDDFQAALAKGSALMYRLDFAEWGPLGEAWSVGSCIEAGADQLVVMSRIRVPHAGAIQPQTWRYTHGNWSVRLGLSASEAAAFLQHVTRGTVAILRAGVPGMDPSDWEPIAMGVVSRFAGAPPEYTLECWDLLTALRHRLDTTAAELPLFYSIGTETTLSADYTSGDTTLTVTSNSGAEKETGENGAVLITPSTGDPAFYLEWGGTSGGTGLTGVVSTVVGGTSPVDAPSGSVVKFVTLIEDHPLDIARKILVSTGGAASTYDTLPASWGLGVPAEVIDDDDIDTWKAALVDSTGTSMTWGLIVAEPIDDALGWLQGILADAGIWLVTRQGLISARCAQEPSGELAPDLVQQRDPILTDFEITDSIILAPPQFDAWAPDQPAEYANSTIRSGNQLAGGYGEDPVATFPAVETVERDLSDRLWGSTNLQSERRDGHSYNLYLWDVRLSESVELVVRLDAAALTPGDIVPITSRHIIGRLDSTGEGYDARRATVLSVAPDWSGSYCRISFAILPTWADQFGDA